MSKTASERIAAAMRLEKGVAHARLGTINEKLAQAIASCQRMAERIAQLEGNPARSALAWEVAFVDTARRVLAEHTFDKISSRAHELASSRRKAEPVSE